MQDASSLARSALQRLALDEQAKAVVMSTPLLYNALFAAVRPYIGGETRFEALTLAKQLNVAGYRVTIDYMGESTRDPDAAVSAVAEFGLLAEEVLAAGLDASISLDLSHLGLLIDQALSIKHLIALAQRLEPANLEVIVSAEGFDRVEDVLFAAGQALKAQKNIGVTLQAYLPRSQDDLDYVLTSAPSVVRVVKGAFGAPQGAHPRGPVLDDAYLKIVERVVSAGVRVSIATHDHVLIDTVIERCRIVAFDRSLIQFEFLAGIAEDQWKRVKDLGFPTQVYVVYGREWFLYLCNRLAEYPSGLIPAFTRAIELLERNGMNKRLEIGLLS